MRWRLVLGLAALAAACSTKNPEQAFLNEVGALSKEEILVRGDALAAKERNEEARRYYSFLADSFPNDTVGRQAALKVADSFFLAKDRESLTEAQLRFKDFANRFPNDPNRAYALLMLGKCSYQQRRGPMRDLTPVREAAASFRQVIELFPSSPHAQEAQELLAKCEEDLAGHELEVARFYLNVGSPEGAQQRLEYLLAKYPRAAAAREAASLLEQARRRLPPARSDKPAAARPTAPPAAAPQNR